MNYTYLGSSGLQVSRICLGSANFGVGPLEQDAPALVQRAIDLGINFFDSASSYGNQPRFDRPGSPTAAARASAEEVLGKALGSRRDEVILASKVGEPVGPGRNDGGLSRVHILRQLEESLRRLRTDHLDIYYAHVDDPHTPIEQTLATFEQLIAQGKIRNYALSRYSATRLIEVLWGAQRLGMEKPVCFQLRYNLDDRSVEADILPAARRHGIDLTCYTALGRGLLAGIEEARREVGGIRQPFNERQLALAESLDKLAHSWGIPPAQVALSWLLAQDGVACAIIGAERPDELEVSIAAADLVLEPEQLAQVSALNPRRPGPA